MTHLGDDTAVLGLAIIALVILGAWIACFCLMHCISTGYRWPQNAVSDYGATAATRTLASVCWGLAAVAAALLAGAIGRLFGSYDVALDVGTDACGAVAALGAFAVARLATAAFVADVQVNLPPEQRVAHDNPRTSVETPAEDAIGAMRGKYPRVKPLPPPAAPPPPPPTVAQRVFRFAAAGARYFGVRTVHGGLHRLCAAASFASVTVSAGCLRSAAAAGTAPLLTQQADLLAGFFWAMISGLCAMGVAAVLSKRQIHVFGLAERVFYAAHIGWMAAVAAILASV